MDVAAVRRRIPGIESNVYMNTGGFGLMPAPTRDAIVGGYQEMVTKVDMLTWYLRVRERANEVRAQIAAFVGAGADEIALKTSVTDGYGSVLWGVDWRPGDRVLVSDEEHGTPRLSVELAARRFGLEVVTLPLRPIEGFMEALRRELGRGARLVALSHVTTDTGTAIPAAEVCRLAREAGTLTLWDGAQAVGQSPLDLTAMGCDFYSSMGYKWLLGPMGTGFLHARRQSQAQLKPVFGEGNARWIDLPHGAFEEGEGAARFEFATHAWPQFDGLSQSLAFLSELGLDRVHERVSAMVDRLRGALAEIRGVEIYTPPPPTGEPVRGIVTFGIEGLTGPELSKELRERWGIVQRAAMMASPRGGVRISIAAYTTEEELQKLLGAVRELAGVRAAV